MSKSMIIGTLLCLGITATEQTAHASGDRVGADASYFLAPWRGWDCGYFADFSGIDDGGFGPEALAVGDLNGDGTPDVVISHSYHGFPGISVLQGLGGGAFAQPTYLGTPGNLTVFEVELHDFDADGDLDVFAALHGGSGNGQAVGLWRNNGDGTLATRQDLTVGTGPREIALADVTGDGIADLISTNHGSISGNTVSMLEHNGLTGPAAGFLPRVDSPTVTGANGLAVVDMNGDGLRDVVVAGDGRRMGVGINAGGGVFDAPEVEYNLNYLSSYTASCLAAGDFDADGDVDVATSSNGHLLIWRNDGSGALSGEGGTEALPFASPVPLDDGVTFSGVNAYRIRAEDVNLDGWVDLLTANSNGRSGESWNLVLGDGAGGFLDPLAFHCSQNTQDIGAVDVDEDGDLDVLTLAHFSSALTVHLNRGSQGFRAIADPAPVQPLSQQIAVADLDLDGDVDAITIADDATILRNPGDGLLVPDALRFFTPTNGKDVHLKDVNGDMYPDMILGPDEQYPPYVVGVAHNDGAGSFLPGYILWPLDPSCGTGTLATGDFDNDGDVDIALSEEQGCFGSVDRRIFLFENLGGGSWVSSIATDQVGGHFGLSTADFNEDGNLDLITAQVAIDITYTVFPGNGDMTFGPALVSPGPIGPTRTYLGLFDVGDLDLDGHLDVVSLFEDRSFGTDVVGVLLGQGNGFFDPLPVNVAPGSSALEALRIGLDVDLPDIDQDGDRDVVITNYASNDISAFLNDGSGHLRSHARYGANLTPVETMVADMDGDALDDLCVLVSRPNVGGGVIVLPGLEVENPVDVEPASPGDPAMPIVHRVYPNPVGAAGFIGYELPRSAVVEVSVYSSMGQRVRALWNGRQDAGHHVVEWDATADDGEPVPSGVYYISFEADRARASHKTVVVR